MFNDQKRRASDEIPTSTQDAKDASTARKEINELRREIQYIRTVALSEIDMATTEAQDAYNKYLATCNGRRRDHIEASEAIRCAKKAVSNTHMRARRELAAANARNAAACAASASHRDALRAVEHASMTALWALFDQEKNSWRQETQDLKDALDRATKESVDCRRFAEIREQRAYESARVVGGANSQLRDELSRRIRLESQLRCERERLRRATESMRRREGACE